MTQETKADSEPAARQPTPAPVDLSETIEKTVDKQSNEEVKSVHVFGDHYRCNWWVHDRAVHWLSATSGRISKSRFLKVTTDEDGRLLIEGMEESRRSRRSHG